MNKKVASFNYIFILGIVFLVICSVLFSGSIATTAKNDNKTFLQKNCLAQSAILMEVDSKRVLFEKNAGERLPMASCTKIVTALTVLNNCDLSDVVQIDSKAVGIEGSSIYLRKGEHLTVQELLYGLMLQSGNDCAVALAIYVGGSIEKFSEMMNETAKNIGAKNSNFENPHGLDSNNHYTTAYDLGLLTAVALQNKDFSKIVSTKSISISNEGNENKRYIKNKNKLLNNFEYANGVKTGYTKKAGRCFVGSATKGNMQLVAVVLKCGPMFEQAKEMLEYGFENYRMKTIFPKNKIFCMSKNKKKFFYRLDEGLYFPTLKDGSEDNKINKTILLDNDKKLNLKITFANRLIFFKQLSIIIGSG